ncbi:MAG: extracellular solute-binding protein [Oscillospiraceae bacterium]|nr:extracellular solute-binding protein [Oscillospiraceae bacterium]
MEHGRKLFAKLIIAAMVLPMIAAAAMGASGETLEPLTFTIWTADPDPGTFVDEDESHKYLREKLGIDIQWEYTASDPETRHTLMLAGGDYPDAIGQKPGPEMDNYITGGHLYDLTDWIAEYTPDLYEKMSRSPEAFDISAEGYQGRFYYVPGQFGYTEEYPCIEPSLGFRLDVWKKLAEDPADLPRPTDLDGFFDMAKAMQEAMPEYDGRKTYAFSGWFADAWGATWSIYALQRFGGSHCWLGSSTQADNWTREYGFDSDEWMWAMRFLNRAYKEGIADPEAVTMNQDAYNQKLAQGIVLTSWYAGDWLDGVANTARAAAGYPEQKLVPYTWMKYPEGSGVTAEQISGQYMPFGLTALYITKNCKDAEEIFKRLAWLATEDGIVFQSMGVEGVDWDYDEEGFRKPKDEVIELALNDPDFVEKTGIGKYAIFSNYYGGYDGDGDAYILTENKYYQAYKEDQYDIEYKELLGIDMGLTVEANAARAGMTRDDNAFAYDLGIVAGEPLGELESQLDAWQAEYIGKLYMAKTDAEFDALIAEWKQKAEKVGYMDYYNHINPIIESAYKEYLASK